jgi:hypothetical protein
MFQRSGGDRFFRRLCRGLGVGLAGAVLAGTAAFFAGGVTDVFAGADLATGLVTIDFLAGAALVAGVFTMAFFGAAF